ncbi:BTAD domain-containing putative transcriptional regulator [Amycolatopsis roodepoortensis]|uniref:DNA-binding SARP family transcriptional activator/tetratricopeptide (TPR) repeat protein n=1 Tax=Amycolatopsis roodepoortensis TaxID=700274 RepID=A0ABR9L1C4_9PSEU|nr:BTAD domain-containing putative transcriptional regulator [Amycolatopsis roodepoortensis]MBE1574424.1 DNA-binding SARP family transcriptional activator/tetratricopeptide (TPR) repeat protein [Amycolatopsis roodepoortensis]
MEFKVLGPLAASVPLPSAAQPRRVLAVLLARPNEFVHRDTLVDELWPQGPPSSAAAVVQMAVSKLRKALSPGVPVDDVRQRVRSGRSGYRLMVSDGELDVAVFSELTAAAAKATGAERRALLDQALGLWRGRAFADVPVGPLVEAHRLWLEDQRSSVLGKLVELELAAGDHKAVADRLGPELAVRPGDERLAGWLAEALHRLGRRDAAMAVLDRCRRALWEHTGVSPGEELLAAHRRIAGTGWSAGGAPCRLPPATPDFTGRAGELAEVGRALRGPAPVVLHGAAGSGKSALAVQAAWRVRKRFPDGQLVADLRDTGDVLAGFLRALGLAEEEIPADRAGRISLWQSRTADRRLLVVLENCRSEAEVRPLLPTGPGCAAIVTTRRRPAGLVGARFVEVGALSDAESRDLLGAITGEARLSAEPDAVRRVLACCDGLALAVRAAGMKLLQRPRLSVAEFAARLENERLRLDELAAGDLGVRPVLAGALAELSPRQRKSLRLLGFPGATEFAGWFAAAMLGRSEGEAAELLDELVDDHVLHAEPDRMGVVRYRLPALIRLALREPPDPEALRRALTAMAALAEHALAALGAEYPPSRRADVPAAVSDRVAADPIGWRDTERANLALAVRTAKNRGWTELAMRLADAYSDLVGPAKGGSPAWLGFGIVRDRVDLPAEAGKLLKLGHAHADAGDLARARTCFSLAETRFRSVGDHPGTGSALIALADVDADTGRTGAAVHALREALDLLRDCGDLAGQAMASAQFGSLWDDLGDFRRAQECFDASLLLSLHCEDGRQHDRSAKRYADVLRRNGRMDEAGELLTSALIGTRSSRERHWEAHVLRSFGDLHAKTGHAGESERCLARSLELFEYVGHRHAAAYTHRSFGESLRLAGEHGRAAEHLNLAMSTFRELGDRRGGGYALLSFGRLRADEGIATEAADGLRTAAGLFRELGFPVWELRALKDLSAVDQSGRQRDRAREALTKIRFGATPA